MFLDRIYLYYQMSSLNPTSSRRYPQMITTFVSNHWPEVLQPFRIRSHGRIHVQKSTLNFGFQIRARDTVPHPALIFGLAQVHGPGPLARFVVRIDLESGDVWDAANENGFLGQVSTCLWNAAEGGLALRWEIEHIGSALLPRLHLGDEEILYPSQFFPSDARFVAFTGHDLEGVEPGAIFAPGAVWCQDRLG